MTLEKADMVVDDLTFAQHVMLWDSRHSCQTLELCTFVQS